MSKRPTWSEVEGETSFRIFPRAYAAWGGYRPEDLAFFLQVSAKTIYEWLRGGSPDGKHALYCRRLFCAERSAGSFESGLTMAGVLLSKRG